MNFLFVHSGFLIYEITSFQRKIILAHTNYVTKAFLSHSYSRLKAQIVLGAKGKKAFCAEVLRMEKEGNLELEPSLLRASLFDCEMLKMACSSLTFFTLGIFAMKQFLKGVTQLPLH